MKVSWVAICVCLLSFSTLFAHSHFCRSDFQSIETFPIIFHLHRRVLFIIYDYVVIGRPFCLVSLPIGIHGFSVRAKVPFSTQSYTSRHKCELTSTLQTISSYAMHSRFSSVHWIFYLVGYDSNLSSITSMS